MKQSIRIASKRSVSVRASASTPLETEADRSPISVSWASMIRAFTPLSSTTKTIGASAIAMA